ncbi:MAG: hypothetical protein GC185_00245 [Alphaproteobacteria bacterium]|nr:hypothetical protein [Alphaproteobacteria bacterium]
MRRSYLTALATVSLAALLSFSTASEAVQAGLSFPDTLKAQNRWKVGIVNPKGASFCAMVNKFDNGVSLAFALNPEGMGSVALDLGKQAFNAGKDYPATLTTADGHVEKVTGHATSGQSVVMQIGRDDAFYDMLSKKPTLDIGLSAFKVSFALKQFEPGYRSLVDCSGSLTGGEKMPAVKVKDVEKEALAPIDREVATLSADGKAPVKTAAKTAASGIDAQIDHDAKTVTAKTVAAVTAKPKKAPVRKLLASAASGDADVPEATDPGATARQWDAQQSSAMEDIRDAEQARKAAYLKQKMAEKDAQIAALKKERNAKAGAELAAYNKQKKELDEKSADLQKQVAALEQANTAGATLSGSAAAAAKANIAEKQAEIAKVKAESDVKTRQMNVQLARAAMEYQQHLGALETDRAGMEKKLEKLTADLTDARKTVAADKSRMDELQRKLSLSRQEQQGLQGSLKALQEKNRKTEAALNAREKMLAEKEKSLSASKADAKELATVRAELKQLRGEHTAAIGGLQDKLSSKTAQYDALKAQYDALQKQNAATASADSSLQDQHRKLTAELTRKEAALAALQQRLDKAQAEADKAAAERTAAAALKQRLDEAQAKAEKAAVEKASTAAALQQRLDAAQAQAEKVAAEKAATLRQRLDEAQAKAGKAEAAKDADVAALQRQLNEAQAEAAKAAAAKEAAVARAASAESRLASAKEEISGIRKSLVVVNDLPDPKVKQAQEALKAQTAAAQSAEAQLEATRQRVEALQQKLQASREQLGTLQQQAAQGQSASAAVERQKQALAKAQDDIAALRAQNARLSKKLAGVALDASPKAAKPAPEKVAAAKKADDAAQQELVRTRAQLAALEKQLGQSQEQIDTLTQQADAAKKAAVVQPAAKPQSSAELKREQDALAAARAEIADLRAKNARLSQSLASAALDATAPAAKKPAVAVAAEKPVKEIKTGEDAKIAMMQAQADIMKLKTEKLALQDKLQQQQEIARDKAQVKSVPVIDWKTDVAAAKPAPAAVPVTPVAAKVAVAKFAPVQPVKTAPVQQASASLRGYSHSYRQTLAGIPVRSAAQPQFQAVPSQQPTLAEARAAAQVQPASGGAKPDSDGFESPDGSFNANSAEAFLDRIMSYHHVPGKKAEPEPMPKHSARVFGDEGKKPAARTVPHQAAAPVMTAPPQQEQMSASTPIPYNGGAEPVRLDTLLHQAGLSTVRFTGGGENGLHVRQWTTGKLNGMVEQLPAGHFDASVQSYIDRYRQDCANQLHVSMGAVQNVAAGTLQQAVVSCPATDNSYDTSFVFLQDGKTFSAILHTGYPSDAAQINNIGDNIAYMLGSSGGLDLSGAVTGHTAAMIAPMAGGPDGFNASSPMDRGMSGPPPVDAPQQPLRLHVPPLLQQGAATPQGGDGDFKTIVVQ